MSFDLTRLRRSNEILAQGFSRPDGVHPRYQYFYSEDLLTATPIISPDGEPLYEYICQCGVDKSVHSPDCSGIIIAAVKFMQMKTAPTITNKFVLCVYFPPPTPERWAALYGSFRYYPSNGRYIPLGVNGHSVQLPYPPHEETAHMTVRMIREHMANHEKYQQEYDEKIELRDAKKTRDYTPPPNSHWANARYRLRDMMTLNGEPVGAKGSVLRFSATTEDPILRHLSQQLSPETTQPRGSAELTPIAIKNSEIAS